MKNFDIIIVGGGLVGYAFALDLAKQNPKFTLAVIEAVKPSFINIDDLDNRIYAIAPDNIAYLKKLGVNIDELRHDIINKMDVSGDLNSNIILDKNYTKNQFLAKTFEYKILQKELYNKISELDNISLIYDNITEIKIEDDNVDLSGANEVYRTRLIVGADGANSFIRKISNIDATLIDYNQSGIVANFKSELPHKNTAYQWFHDGEILAYLPLDDNNISIVWSSNKPDKLLKIDEEDFAKMVSAAGNYQLGLLKLVTKPVAFPLRMHLLSKIYANKVVLIGDAAHTIHPLAGQGVNLGFRDARMLSITLAKLASYQLGEIGVLAKYNAKRQIEVKEMQLTCHLLHKLFAANNEITKTLRNTGLNLVNKFPLLKKTFMNIAN